MNVLNKLFLTTLSVMMVLVSFAQPANNNCGGAILLPVTSVCSPTQGTTIAATQSQAGCVGNADDDVWYMFTANRPSVGITVSAITTGFDQLFRCFSGTCGGSSLKCENSTGNGGTESITLNNLFNGVTYWVRVYHQGNGSGTGLFNICVHDPVAEPFCDPDSPEPANSMNPCAAVPKICNVNGFCGTTQGYHPTLGSLLTAYMLLILGRNCLLLFVVQLKTIHFSNLLRQRVMFN